MAHQRRVTQRGVRQRKRYKWCATAQTKVVETAVATSIAEIPILCAGISDMEIQGDVTIERVFVHISTIRLLTGQLAAFAGVVAIQKLNAAGALLQVIDALEVTNPQFSYGSKDIMWAGQIPVPGTVLKSDDSRDVTRETAVYDIDIKVRRKLGRATHAFTLNLNIDVTAILSTFVQGRVLLSYS